MASTPGTAVSNVSWMGSERRPLLTMLVTRFIAMISNQLTGLAVPWFVLTITGSATKMGVTAAVTLLPTAIMAIFGGAIADRMNPRRLSVMSDVISGVTVAMVPLLFALDLLTFPLLLLLMFLGSVFDMPGYAARGKMIPLLAERGSVALEMATSIQGMFQAISMLFGAVLAGVLIGLMGATSVLWINAAVFLLSALSFQFLIPDLHVPREDKGTVLEDIREGVRYVAGNRLLRTFIGVALMLNFLIGPLMSILMPYLANTVWQSPGKFGFVMSGFGLGALTGSLAFGKLSGRMSRRRIMTIAMTLFALPIFALVPVPGVVMAWGAVALMGLGSGLVNPMFGALIMRIVPNALLGRVNGVIDAGAMVAMPASMFIAGPMLDAIGLRNSFLVVAIASTMLSAYAIFTPNTATLDSLEEPAAG